MQIPAPVRATLRSLVDLLERDATAPSSVRDAERAWRVHVADSLSGLEVDRLRNAASIVDIGAGAGFPGLVLAVALPSARIDLVESVERKCGFMRRAIDETEIANARVVCRRAEAWAQEPPPRGGREAYQAATARAVGRLATLAELAAPLLVKGGELVAWKGRRDPDEERELERARAKLGMEPVRVSWVGPYAGSRHRHLHVLRKHAATPDWLPRRPGM